MVMRWFGGGGGGEVCASAMPAVPATMLALSNLPNQCRRLLPSPLWGGVGGGGPIRDVVSVKQPRPPSLTLPHRGGGNRPSKRRSSSANRRGLIIDDDAPGNAPDRNRNERLSSL